MKKLILVLSIFLIWAGPAYSQNITVKFPNGGENWTLGRPYNITWSSSGISGTVGIKLFRNDISIGYIAQNVPDTGTFSWTIANVIRVGPVTAGSNYKIQVKKDGVAGDLSDRSFTISNRGKLSYNFKGKTLTSGRSTAQNTKPKTQIPPHYVPPSNPPLNRPGRPGGGVGPFGLPDLVVRTYRQTPPKPIEGQDWRFIIQIKNIGTGEAFIPKGTNYIKYSNYGYNIQGFVRNTHKNILIKPGGIFNAETFNTHFRSKSLRSKVIFTVDPIRKIKESNEDNNTKEGYFYLEPKGESDLIISDISAVETPKLAGFKIKVTIKNQGDGVASFKNRLGQPTTLLRSIGSAHIDKIGTDQILPGNYLKSTFFISPLSRGIMDLTIIVDPDNKVYESIEDNNTKSQSFNVK